MTVRSVGFINYYLTFNACVMAAHARHGFAVMSLFCVQTPSFFSLFRVSHFCHRRRKILGGRYVTEYPRVCTFSLEADPTIQRTAELHKILNALKITESKISRKKNPPDTLVVWSEAENTSTTHCNPSARSKSPIPVPVP